MATGPDEDLLSVLSDQINEESTSSATPNVDKLKELLRQESKCRKETGHCYDTLQKEYDTLLCKYAEAENTIDELRIGAKVNLYSDGPNLHVVSPSDYHVRSKSVQQIILSKPLRTQITRTHSLPNTNKLEDEESENGTDSLRLGVLLKLRDLQDDVSAFQDALGDQEYSYNEQKQLYGALKTEYENIVNELDRIKGLENDPDNRNAGDFVQSNSLEGELYRLGLRLEEIDEEISEQLRNKIRNDSQDKRMTTETKNKAGCQKVGASRNSEDDVFIKELTGPDRESKKKHWRPGTEDLTKPGDYASQTPRVEEFDAKYLSRSLGPIEKAVVLSGENPTGFWLSPEQPLLVSTERDQRNSLKKERIRTRSVESESPTRSANQLQQDKHPYRPNTMNSTEDSGFIESEQPLNYLHYKNKQRSERLSKTLISDNNHVSTSEEYRERLNALRDFLLSKRSVDNSLASVTSRKASRTPRSWVRGISPTRNHSPSASEVYESSNASPRKVDVTDNALDRCSLTAPKEYVEQLPEYLKDHKSYSESRTMEALQGEMQDIRNMVLDLRSSLPPHQYQPKSPIQKRLAPRSRSPSSRMKHHKSKQKNHLSNSLPEDMLTQQLEMFKQLNRKIDHLSVKLDDNASLSAGTDRYNHADRSSDAHSTASAEVRAPEVNNTTKSQSAQISTLEKLSMKIDQLSKRLKDKENERIVSSDIDSPLSYLEGKNLVTTLEQKLKDLSEQLQGNSRKSVNDSPGSTMNSTTPVYIFSCPVCGEVGTHRHGDYLFNSKVDFTPGIIHSDGVPRENTKSRYFTDKHPSFTKTKVCDTGPHHHYMTQSTPTTENGYAASNIFHHYHSFYGPDTPRLNVSPGTKKNISVGSRALKYSNDRLNDSLNEASLAAHKMESMSKRMLKNMATDLFNSGASEF